MHMYTQHLSSFVETTIGFTCAGSGAVCGRDGGVDLEPVPWWLVRQAQNARTGAASQHERRVPGRSLSSATLLSAS
jgi:hypothetical protein